VRPFSIAPPSSSRKLGLIAALLMLAGCSFFQAPSQSRGNKIDPDALKELTPGTSTRADATALLGSPTAKATFDDNSWIYISETTRPRIARTQGVLNQNVVVLTFNTQGVLQDVKRLNEDDSLPVTVVSRVTPSPGSESSVMQQLLGNIGRFGPGMGAGALGQGEAPSGGAPSPAP
jgi:outer membrane protein assembly factor BamE (lipoprotein component of BamABCDE complex)